MVFTREGLIYEKANPALYSSNGVQAVNSVSLLRDRLRRDAEGKLTTPANSWVCRINNDYHLLPRGKKTLSSAVANSFEMTNTQLLKVDDPLTLLQPHTTLNASALVVGTAVTITLEGVTVSYTVAAGSITPANQIVNLINTSAVLSSKIYALVAASAPTTIHVFAKKDIAYTIATTGVAAANTVLVKARPIGTVAALSSDASTYKLVTVTPSAAAGAIATTAIPDKAVIDAPIYHEIVGLFNSSISFEDRTQQLVAPVHGANGMNVFALSHFDDCLREMFPKITFIENNF